jgi:dihydroneopterin aldolase/2-amino-4-hydroxy-6-hydroxymethyldihydropteridine diphosphokinase/dihydropteroate synthase/2-amino-4-hydroxy-6-hydroxymethyldihydropteridine diphosphokinase/dihydropteroate synthase
VFPIRDALWNFSDRTFIMGILNVTPDSFSDGGNSFSLENALENVQLMLHSADIIDIGGQSTRPDAVEVSVEEELRRVVPVIEAIRKVNATIPISVDTFRAEVAQRAIEAGADLINDVSGGRRDTEMLKVMQKMAVPICLMHMRGNSKTMMSKAQYEGGLLAGIRSELLEVVTGAISTGIYRWKIVIDPGIGFAKDFKQNYELLSNLSELTNSESKLAGMPILVGVSRKSFIGNTINQSVASKRGWGSAAATTASILGGACIIRVHDVAEMKDVALVTDQLKIKG